MRVHLKNLFAAKLHYGKGEGKIILPRVFRNTEQQLMRLRAEFASTELGQATGGD